MARTHPLAIPIHMPDALQVEGLRLPDASCEATRKLLVTLWPELDRFTAESTAPAWKQVDQYAVKRELPWQPARARRPGAGVADPASVSLPRAGLPDHPAAALGRAHQPDRGKRLATKDYQCIHEAVRALRAEQQEAEE
jgi:hypothetical protein